MSRLIRRLDDAERLQKADDGYVVCWDYAQGGYWTAAHLREIADELDRRNKTWHEQVMRDLGPPMPKIKPLVWVDCEYNDGWQEAVMPLCRCYVMHRDGEWKAKKAYQGHVGEHCDWFDTEAEAKAWCEQEYERRVRECLE